MPSLRAYELETTVTNGTIRVDPRLEGHKVKAIILDVESPRQQENWLDAIMDHRTPVSSPIEFLSREEANARR